MPDEHMMPNDALRLLFYAIEEVMGTDGMKAVLHGAKLESYIDNYPPKNLDLGVKFSDYGKAEQAVEEFYGPRGAKAMLQQVGRATFNYAMKEQPAVLGLAGAALKLMPLNTTTKQKLLLEQLVGAALKLVNQPTHLEEDAESFMWVVDQCVCIYRPKHDAPCCYANVGAMVEAMRWLTDKIYSVQEVTCLNAGGDACRFQISKRPIE